MTAPTDCKPQSCQTVAVADLSHFYFKPDIRLMAVPLAMATATVNYLKIKFCIANVSYHMLLNNITIKTKILK